MIKGHVFMFGWFKYRCFWGAGRMLVFGEGGDCGGFEFICWDFAVDCGGFSHYCGGFAVDCGCFSHYCGYFAVYCG